jgi:MraZ protein
MDGQGRILVPPELREFAGLDKRVALVGQVNKFELWDADVWTRNRDLWLSQVEQGVATLSKDLENLSI